MDWEFELLYALQGIHNPVLDKIMVVLSVLGNAGIFWTLIGIVLLISRKYRRGGAQVLMSIVVTFIIGNLLLKTMVARERPCWIDPSVALLVHIIPTDYSFPSGHTMNGFTTAVSLCFVDKRMGIPALFLATLIAFSRLYNFVHFPTDVLAGFILGVSVALLVNLLFVKMGWKSERKKRR